MKKIILTAATFAMALACSAFELPSTNSYPWAPGVTAGVQGGIPVRTVIFTNLVNFDPTGVTNCASVIQAAINACPANQVVLLPEKTFDLQTPLILSGRVLRGSGPGTVLRWTGGWTMGVIQVATDSSPFYAQSITSGYVQSSTNITLADASNFAVGQPLNIYQTAAEPFTRLNVPIHQLELCTGKVGNTLTFWPPLCWGDTNVPAFCASELYWKQNAGIENLKISWASTAEGNGIFFDQALNCWVRGVEMEKVPSTFILCIASLFCDIRDNWIHDSGANTANAGNGIQLYGDTRTAGWLGCSGFLIENNALINLQPSIMLSISASRNVISYNYSHGGRWPGMVMGSDYNINHQGHDMFNLLEGNIGHSVQSDGYHGSASHSTIFRNWLGHKYPDATFGYQRALDLNRWSYHHWAVGNILGDPTVTGYAWDVGATNPPPNGYSYFVPVIYRAGFPNMGNNAWDGTIAPTSTNTAAWDSDVYPTTYRHGNYDYATKGTQWNDALGDRTLPASLIYSARPGWFSNYGPAVFPPFGPDVPGLTNVIPAQLMLAKLLTPAPIPEPLPATVTITNIVNVTNYFDVSATNWVTETVTETNWITATNFVTETSWVTETNYVTLTNYVTIKRWKLW